MREIFLDLSDRNSNPVIFAGYEGEHNATKVTVILPQEMLNTNEITTFFPKYRTSWQESFIGDKIELIDQKLTFIIHQSVTRKGKTELQIEGCDADNNIIMHSPVGFLLFGGSVGEQFDKFAMVINNEATFINQLNKLKSLPVEKGEGNYAVQQVLDTGSYSWTVNNPSVQELLIDKNIITLNENGRISNIGASGKFSSVFCGKGLALGKRSFVYGTSGIAYGDYSSAGGDQALAYGLGSDAMGCATSAIGPYSSVKGMESKAVGEGSDAGGYATQAEGRFSFTRGFKTIATGLFATTFGAETSANESCQFVVGKHNDNKSNTLFEVGNGSGEGETPKSNAFEVYLDGHAEVQTQGTTDNSIVTKKYVDNIKAEIENIKTSIEATLDGIIAIQENLIGGDEV